MKMLTNSFVKADVDNFKSILDYQILQVVS